MSEPKSIFCEIPTSELKAHAEMILAELKLRSMAEGDPAKTAAGTLYLAASQAVAFFRDAAKAKPDNFIPCTSRYPILPSMICKTTAKDAEHAQMLKLLKVGESAKALVNAESAQAIQYQSVVKQWALAMYRGLHNAREALLKSRKQNPERTPNPYEREILALPDFSRATSHLWARLGEKSLPEKFEGLPEFADVKTGDEVPPPAHRRKAILKAIAEAMRTIAPAPTGTK